MTLSIINMFRRNNLLPRERADTFDIAIKVGESLYMCRTCKREGGSTTELCHKCYTEESPKHKGHEFSQLITERVDDMPDDENIQLANLWRCTACSFGMHEFSYIFHVFIVDKLVN